MDSHNLATLFGPNILHKAKAVGDKGYPVESAERAEERKEVIGVIQDLIDNHGETFEVRQRIHLVFIWKDTDKEFSFSFVMSDTIIAYCQ